jgi:hypothetical protein
MQRAGRDNPARDPVLKANAMIKNDEPASKALTSVLIPVVVGSLLGLFASLSTTAYTTWTTQKETIRKERLSHLEQAMTLCSRYSNDLGRAIGVGLVTKGKVDAQSVDTLTAPTKALLELKVVTALYLPALRADVDELVGAHNAVMLRYDEIIDAGGKHGQEDAAAFAKRIQTEFAPLVSRVNALMSKLGELAQHDAG